MKIFLAQQNYHIGNFEENTEKIIAAIREAKQRGGELVVFSELAVCGYPPRDFLEFNDFIERSLASIDMIAAETNDIAALVGAPSRNPAPEGKNLFNSAYFLYQGKTQAIINKTLLPNYDIFDEYRYFEPSFHWQVIEYKDKRLAVTICEDIWDMGDDPLYRFKPMDKLIEQNPDLMINLSASPFDYMHAEGRKSIVKKNVTKYGLPMVYCNAVGSQTEIVFDGGSIAMNASGDIVAELPYFEEGLQAVEFTNERQFAESVIQSSDTVAAVESISQSFNPNTGVDAIHRALITGIRDYFRKMNFKKAVVASSGGIDSALVLALACEAPGP